MFNIINILYKLYKYKLTVSFWGHLWPVTSSYLLNSTEYTGKYFRNTINVVENHLIPRCQCYVITVWSMKSLRRGVTGEGWLAREMTRDWCWCCCNWWWWWWLVVYGEVGRWVTLCCPSTNITGDEHCRGPAVSVSSLAQASYQSGHAVTPPLRLI